MTKKMGRRTTGRKLNRKRTVVKAKQYHNKGTYFLGETEKWRKWKNRKINGGGESIVCGEQLPRVITTSENRGFRGLGNRECSLY